MSEKLIETKMKEEFSKREWTRLINSLSGFKGANLIGSISEDGITNLSVISSCFHVGAHPPLMGFVVRPNSDKSPRHTLNNINATQYYTINHISESIYKKAHQTSARYPQKVSEFNEVGLTEEFKKEFKAPFVKECSIKIGMKKIDVLDITHNKTHIVIGEVERVYLPEETLMSDGFIDLDKAQTVAVSGLDSYHTTNRLSRLSYAKPDQPVEEIEFVKD